VLFPVINAFWVAFLSALYYFMKCFSRAADSSPVEVCSRAAVSAAFWLAFLSALYLFHEILPPATSFLSVSGGTVHVVRMQFFELRGHAAIVTALKTAGDATARIVAPAANADWSTLRRLDDDNDYD
jgi:hypothetical protein